MKCHACSQPNPDGHSYCGFCGRPLQQDKPLAGSQQEVALRAAALEDLQDRLGVIEKQAIDRIQDATIKWAKGLMYLYGIALTILLVALSLFGIKQVSDVDKWFDNVQKRLQENEKTVQEKTKELSATLDQEFANANKKFSDLHTNLEGLTSGVNAEQEHLQKLNETAKGLRFEEAFKELGELRNHLKADIREVRQVKEEQTKFDRSLFEIHLQFDGGPEQTQGSIETLLQPLSEQGFVVEEANILRIGVDKNEVIYYNRLAHAQSRLIADTLKPQFPAISTRFANRKERNAREILIKLVR
jgi:Skp family chaperone for outer membrane proteins